MIVKTKLKQRVEWSHSGLDGHNDRVTIDKGTWSKLYAKATAPKNKMATVHTNIRRIKDLHKIRPRVSDGAYRIGSRFSEILQRL